MTEGADFTPAPYFRGHDFKTEYANYDRVAKRSYDAAEEKKVSVKDLFPPRLTTKSKAPVVVITDETDSMEEWPKTIFSKLPYLYHEAQDYLGSDVEISIAAIGDANNHGEKYWLQVRPFTKEAGLKTELEKLILERLGGGQMSETYELGAAYYAYNVDMPNAVRPVLILIGDEKPYPVISAEHAKLLGLPAKRLTTQEVFRVLQSKWSVYFIRKPYRIRSGNRLSDEDQEIRRTWVELLGEERIADLPAPERVVDVIFGIFAQEVSRVPDFHQEIRDRQRPEQVKVVLESLRTIHAMPKGKDDGSQSRLFGHDGSGKKTKPLV